MLAQLTSGDSQLDRQITVELILQVVIPLVLLLIACTAGRFNERRHLRALARRRAALGSMLVTDLRGCPGGADPRVCPQLVVAEVIISIDHFRGFLQNIRKVFGGELRGYERLMSRARDEAMTRLLEAAKQAGCDAVCNLRIQGVDVGGATTSPQGRIRGRAAILATATAYRLPARPIHGDHPPG